MRTVDRGLVPRPAPLDPTQTAADVTAYRACTSTSGVKQRIYGHSDVVHALHGIFFRKCSFCEADATTSGKSSTSSPIARTARNSPTNGPTFTGRVGPVTSGSEGRSTRSFEQERGSLSARC
jgi:hypothetical protein